MITKYMPAYYKKSLFLNYLSESIDEEKKKVEEYWIKTKREYFVKKTVDNIYDWEREFKVPSYLNQTIETRRGNVLGKMRGYGTANKKFIKNVVKGFYENQNVDIEEDYENSIITLKFTTKKELPANYKELERSLNELLPCHLNFEYKFIFALDNYNHEELEPYKHRVLEGAKHSGGKK